jgi:phosphohistidine phosphatase
MRTVSLYRHAKSSWDDPSLEDFDRGLSKRGKTSASRMGDYIRDAGLVPDLVLSSKAVRTRETLRLTFGDADAAPEIRLEQRLYLACASTMLDMLRGLRDEVTHVMILGHNPGLHALALDLFSRGEPASVDALCRKFPTCGLAVIDLEVGSWRTLGVGDGYLRRFITPKSLPEQADAPV